MDDNVKGGFAIGACTGDGCLMVEVETKGCGGGGLLGWRSGTSTASFY